MVTSLHSKRSPYKEHFRILTARKLEREQNLDEAGGGGAPRHLLLCRVFALAARMR